MTTMILNRLCGETRVRCNGALVNHAEIARHMEKGGDVIVREGGDDITRLVLRRVVTQEIVSRATVDELKAVLKKGKL
jgi:hypothetical protein